VCLVFLTKPCSTCLVFGIGAALVASVQVAGCFTWTSVDSVQAMKSWIPLMVSCRHQSRNSHLEEGWWWWHRATLTFCSTFQWLAWSMMGCSLAERCCPVLCHATRRLLGCLPSSQLIKMILSMLKKIVLHFNAPKFIEVGIVCKKYTYYLSIFLTQYFFCNIYSKFYCPFIQDVQYPNISKTPFLYSQFILLYVLFLHLRT
jgi:hypothetical protein